MFGEVDFDIVIIDVFDFVFKEVEVIKVFDEVIEIFLSFFLI